MRLINILLLLFLVANLNGCVITGLLVIRATEKDQIRPILNSETHSPITNAFANKDRTKYYIHYKIHEKSNIKEYCLLIDSNMVRDQLPKNFLEEYSAKKLLYKKNMTYRYIDEKHLYELHKFKNKIICINDKHHLSDHPGFESITPIIQLEVKEDLITKPDISTKSDTKNNDILKLFNPEVDIVVNVKNYGVTRFSANRVYIKLNIHENLSNEFICIDLNKYNGSALRMSLLIFTPVTVAADIITSPIQLAGFLILVNTWK